MSVAVLMKENQAPVLTFVESGFIPHVFMYQKCISEKKTIHGMVTSAPSRKPDLLVKVVIIDYLEFIFWKILCVLK